MKNQLKKIVAGILSIDKDYSLAVGYVKQLEEFYNNLLEEYNLEKLSAQKETPTYKGVALDPKGAIDCLPDHLRTSKFIIGIYNAFKDLEKKFNGEKIHIVYGGCGPLAVLILPLLSICEPEKVKVTFIDIHQTSLDSVKFIVDKLEFHDFVNSYVCNDAAKYKFNEEDKLHIAVSETMYTALFKEGQVSVSHNLGSQVCEGGVLIPEDISISCALVDSHNEMKLMKQHIGKPSCEQPDYKSYRYNLGEVFSINLEKIKENFVHDSGEFLRMPDKLPGERIKFPKGFSINYNPMLCTEIIVYNSIKISEYESGLTIPMSFKLEEPFNKLKGIEFYYDLSDCPQVKCIPISKNGFGWIKKLFD